MTLQAKDVISLLRDKHAGDIFVSECKTGGTYVGNGMRMDAWVMKRTWCPPTTIGYEVKVGRSDFLKDDKWPAYLDGCHLFYFVCPYGLISPEETPDGCGLMWVAKTGTRIYTKRKAPRRDIDWPGEVMAYVLMTRSEITESRFRHFQEQSDEAYWRHWLQEKKERRSLGRRVKGRIADIAKRIEQENEELRHQMEDYDEIRQRVAELGFDSSKPVSGWRVRDRLGQLASQIPESLEDNLSNAAAQIKMLRDRIARMKRDVE